MSRYQKNRNKERENVTRTTAIMFWQMACSLGLQMACPHPHPQPTCFHQVSLGQQEITVLVNRYPTQF